MPQNDIDPPARVGRVANVSGTVSFRNAGDTQWSAASVNFPVSTGNSFWTEPAAAVRLEVSDSRAVLAPQTELDVTALDASGLQAVAAQGEVYLHLVNLQPNEAWTVQTPRGEVRLAAAGRYDIIVGSTDQPTQVTVLDGAAQVSGPNLSLQVGPNQTASITGTDTFQGSVSAVVRTGFLAQQLAAERPPSASMGSVPAPVVAQVTAMPGGSDLTTTGSWSSTPSYGQVWYPPVQTGWVPYRQGHWAYIAPWGWTWVDNAPWGFAPFHYGRWVEVGDRWGWTPGEVQVAGPPVYAPALVTFLGIAAAAAIGAAIAGGNVGWVPLGPNEPYHPWYHASDNYFRQVNVHNVTNITTINNRNVTINNYINRGAATSVPAAAMADSRPIQGLARPIPPQQFAAARPVFGQQPIRPTAATVGVTPVVARQLNIATPANRLPHAAPGPVVRAQAEVPNGRTPERPPLPGTNGAQPNAAQPNAAQRPNEPGRPAGNEAVRAGEAGRPGIATPARPALPTPNERPGGVPAPEQVRPGQAAPNAVTPGARQEVNRPGVVATPQTARPAEVQRNEAARPGTTAAAPAVPAPHPNTAVQAPHAAVAVQPHPEAVRPAAPHVQTPAAHVEAPAARVEAPAARVTAPVVRPAAPAPHIPAAAPAPHPPAPPPHPEAAARPPAPAPHPQPPHAPEKKPEQH